MGWQMRSVDVAGIGVGLLLCGLLAGSGWLIAGGVLAFLYAIWPREEA
jgi:hypothetical protein